jgi:hypothetical protein
MGDPVSRRRFLASASAGVAAGVAATVAATSGIAAVESLLAAPAAAPAAPEEPDLTPVGGQVMAHIRNAATGEISVLTGTHEVVYHDRVLVGRLLAGARRAGGEG